VYNTEHNIVLFNRDFLPNIHEVLINPNKSHFVKIKQTWIQSPINQFYRGKNPINCKPVSIDSFISSHLYQWNVNGNIKCLYQMLFCHHDYKKKYYKYMTQDYSSGSLRIYRLAVNWVFSPVEASDIDTLYYHLHFTDRDD
jgi:hypothetical protein